MLALQKKAALILSFFVVGLFFLLPIEVYAQKPLVPCGLNANLSDQCQLCDLVKLVQNVIDFIILYLAAPFATLLIAWAGIKLMVFADNESERTKARQLLWDILIGFLVILLAWTIVIVIMNALVKDSKAEDSSWFRIECTARITPPMGLDQVKPGLVVITPEGAREFYTQIQAQERLNGKAAIKSGVILQGISPLAINEVIYAKEICPSCSLIVTSGLDGTHSTTGTFSSHANGYKVDLRYDATLAKIVQSGTQFEANGVRSDGALLYKNKSTGAMWALEDLGTKNAHFDIQAPKGS